MSLRINLTTQSNRLVAAINLVEARLTRKRYLMRLAKLESGLAKLISRYFTKQGVMLRKTFTRVYGALSEADSPSADDFTGLFEQTVKSLHTEYADLIQSTLNAVLTRGANDAIADYNLALSFNLKHPTAVAYSDRALTLLRELDATTKEEIKLYLRIGLENGDSYNEIAKRIIDRFPHYAMLPKRGPTHIRSRAQLVAINEAGIAYQKGNYAMMVDATKTGLVFEKTWLTVGDDRVSDGCKANASAGWILLTDNFPSGHLHPTRFPGCRCTNTYRRKK